MQYRSSLDANHSESRTLLGKDPACKKVETVNVSRTEFLPDRYVLLWKQVHGRDIWPYPYKYGGYISRPEVRILPSGLKTEAA